MASERLTIRLSDKLQTGLASLSAATGRSESELAREALDEYLSRHAAEETCYDLARRLGLIGCIKGGPADVSTNARHMEGFGSD